MRLIDADALSEHKFQEVEFHGGSLNAAYRQGWNDAIDAIVDNEPPVDAVPVRHGRWIPCNSKYGHDEKVYLCNQCNHNVGFKKMNFCPNCGAKMDGKGNGNEID